MAKRRDRPVLKIDHEDRRSEERRDDEEYRLRLAIGERRKALHQSRTLAVVTGAVKRRVPAWHKGLDLSAVCAESAIATIASYISPMRKRGRRLATPQLSGLGPEATSERRT